jgi:large subunit ribosomal protein L16
MLQPKRTKFESSSRAAIAGSRSAATRRVRRVRLKTLERGELTARQIEAARRAMTRFVKRGGNIWIRVFPDKPITKKPLEVRQGKGKGNVEYWVAQVQPGRMLYEIAASPRKSRAKAFTLASAKLLGEDHVHEADGVLMKAKETGRSSRHDGRELGEELLKLRREQFNLRMQAAPVRARSPISTARCASRSRG